MFKHTPFLVDAHKWSDNKVETCDVHGALKPLHGSQRRTQIVASVSKVAWMRVTQMLSESISWFDNGGSKWDVPVIHSSVTF